ncbi:MAG: response regulator [Lachnospiraceae bacterium]|nr:response regulator [Lachnospiraceae bacterium]
MTMQDNKAALLVGICDDEEHIHRTVEDMLSLYAESNQIRLHIVHYDSAKQLLEKKDELDLLLLDIEMPEMDGIEAGRKLRAWNMEYKIIMLTAREDRYREAFKIGAFRFVPKPIDRTELYRAMDDVREHLVAMGQVTVFRDGVAYQIAQRDILYVEADRSATLIFTERFEFRSERSLTGWRKVLDERVFFQCHKSFLVNMSKIEKIEGNVIRLMNGNKVAVSRRLRNPLLQAYMTFDTSWR